jgi:hypothetical protein
MHGEAYSGSIFSNSQIDRFRREQVVNDLVVNLQVAHTQQKFAIRGLLDEAENILRNYQSNMEEGDDEKRILGDGRGRAERGEQLAVPERSAE